MGLRNCMRDDALINLQGDNHGTVKRKHSAKCIKTKYAPNTAHATAEASYTLYGA